MEIVSGLKNSSPPREAANIGNIVGTRKSPEKIIEMKSAVMLRIITAVTLEHGRWEQTTGLITADAGSPVKCLVPLPRRGTRHLTKSVSSMTNSQKRYKAYLRS